jgi:hypothetical protein
MGTCESVDGKALNAGNAEQCWKAGGARWKTRFNNITPNPNIPAAVSKLEPTSAEAAKVVSDAKVAQATAVVATVAADKAATTAAVATQNAEAAKTTAVVATQSANDAKAVRDKCIAAANDAHKKAMEVCGPDGMKKEGFGHLDMASTCGMWLLFVVIMLVFVAICMQGVSSTAAGESKEPFTISSALV